MPDTIKRMQVTVVIPTHDPDPERLRRTLAGLDGQSLPFSEWELVIVDNGSTPPVSEESVRPHFGGTLRVVREETLGLSHARKTGIAEAATGILVFSDDDNVFDPGYLARALERLREHPDVGVAGGKSLPEYQSDPPSWYVEGMAPLGCRDLGEKEKILRGADFLVEKSYPEFAPIGAGMVFRKEAIATWIDTVGKSGISDRKGNSLSSAGDCDMVLHALDASWSVAYWPELVLHHLLPEGRLTRDYLGAISRAAYRDYIRVLDHHGIRPWSPVPAWTLPFRKARAWFRERAWSGPRAFVQWSSAVGNFEGRTSLSP